MESSNGYGNENYQNGSFDEFGYFNENPGTQSFTSNGQLMNYDQLYLSDDFAVPLYDVNNTQGTMQLGRMTPVYDASGYDIDSFESDAEIVDQVLQQFSDEGMQYILDSPVGGQPLLTEPNHTSYDLLTTQDGAIDMNYENSFDVHGNPIETSQSYAIIDVNNPGNYDYNPQPQQQGYEHEPHYDGVPADFITYEQPMNIQNEIHPYAPQNNYDVHTDQYGYPLQQNIQYVPIPSTPEDELYEAININDENIGENSPQNLPSLSPQIALRRRRGRPGYGTEEERRAARNGSSRSYNARQRAIQLSLLETLEVETARNQQLRQELEAAIGNGLDFLQNNELLPADRMQIEEMLRGAEDNA